MTFAGTKIRASWLLNPVLFSLHLTTLGDQLGSTASPILKMKKQSLKEMNNFASNTYLTLILMQK